MRLLSYPTGCIVWLTGLPASGKTTVSNRLTKLLASGGTQVLQLDGDVVRSSLCADLDFTHAGRLENIRRIASVALIAGQQGLVSIVSAISPSAEQRRLARAVAGTEVPFIETWVKCPLELCEQRDPKGNYARARRGEIANFTGIQQAYEEPQSPDITLDTSRMIPAQCAGILVRTIEGALLKGNWLA